MSVKAEIKGLREAQKKIEQVIKDLRGTPFLQAMRDATLIVQRAAKINAPVDTGRLRSSITPEIRNFNNVVQGVVGSNVEYAPKIEKPGRVRRSGRRPYLQPAFEENREKIIKLINLAVGRIVEQ